MKALYFKQQLELRDVDPVAPKADEALIRVRVAGICNTDQELVKGYMGFEGVLGHEFVGVVEESAQPGWVGKRVCGEINLGCGECAYCRKGLSRHCPNRTVLGILNHPGAFAEWVTLPVSNLHEVPDAMPDRIAVFVEPTAAALEILEQRHVEPNSEVAVIGDGKLGLIISQVLRLTGSTVWVVGKHERKLSLASEWGVRTIHVDDVSVEQFDLVVEASGAAAGFATAMQLVRPRGTIVLKSTYQGDLQFNAAPLVIDEVTVLGSRCGPFTPAMRLLNAGQVNPEPLIDAVYPFEQALEAFEHANRKGTLKILLEMAE